MSPQPYQDTEPDVDLPSEDHGPANECANCGNREGPLFWGACRVLEGSDSLGDRYRYFAGYRCADPKACRKRQAGPKPAVRQEIAKEPQALADPEPIKETREDRDWF
jgi:hypothetical protein